MAQPLSRFKKIVVVSSVAALGFLGAGVAVAYWTSTGTGEGVATTGESVAFEIASEPAVGIMAPGSAGQTVAFTVTNPGTGNLYLNDVDVVLADAAGVPWVPAGACDPADYTAVVSTPPPVGDIAPGGEVDGVITVTLANTGFNQDDCQNQDVPLYLVAS
jgi:hypothetical protein